MYEAYDAEPFFLAWLVERAAARRAEYAANPAPTRPTARRNLRATIANVLFGSTFLASASVTALVAFGK
jgi:hypothetical protein